MAAMNAYTYQLPADRQKLEQDARTAAQKEVTENYPDVLRVPETIANHARALCEEELASNPNTTNDRQAYIDLYTAAYTQTYQDRMQKLDANEQGQQ
jgi:hypothetical protein